MDIKTVEDITEHFQCEALMITEPAHDPGKARLRNVFHFDKLLDGHALVYMADTWESMRVLNAAYVWLGRERSAQQHEALKTGKRMVRLLEFSYFKLSDCLVIVCVSLPGRRKIERRHARKRGVVSPRIPVELPDFRYEGNEGEV